MSFASGTPPAMTNREPPRAAARPAVEVMLEAFYRDRVAPRLAGMPFLNPRLAVRAVGFSLWQGQWLGGVVTPWCLNLTLLPADPAAWPRLAAGTTRRVQFAAGDFDFVCALDAGVGEHHDCSLFSPMLAFADQQAAVATAGAALLALHRALPGLDAAGHDRLDCVTPSAARPAPCSRRGFLRLAGRTDGH